MEFMHDGQVGESITAFACCRNLWSTNFCVDSFIGSAFSVGNKVTCLICAMVSWTRSAKREPTRLTQCGDLFRKEKTDGWARFDMPILLNGFVPPGVHA